MEVRQASKQASTSQAPRPPIAHFTKHTLDPIPQSARNQFALNFPVVTPYGSKTRDSKWHRSSDGMGSELFPRTENCWIGYQKPVNLLGPARTLRLSSRRKPFRLSFPLDHLHVSENRNEPWLLAKPLVEMHKLDTGGPHSCTVNSRKPLVLHTQMLQDPPRRKAECAEHSAGVNLAETFPDETGNDTRTLYCERDVLESETYDWNHRRIEELLHVCTPAKPWKNWEVVHNSGWNFS